WRQAGDIVMPAAFFLMLATVFAIAMQGRVTAEAGTGVIWVGALLSLFLASPSLYQQELRDGMLEQLFLQMQSFEIYVLIRTVLLCVLTGVPLLLCVPIGMMFLGLSWQVLPVLMPALLIGIAATCALMSFAASVMLGYGQAPLVRIGIVLPMCIPVVIFGVAASQENAQALGWLAAYFFLLLPVTVWAGSQAIRAQLAES
ncbi:MAG: heme exporter protein CcmB, partial [Alphaproteobacteria bacterium]|nr:heme exporter protein CcmB [Alphaproteobacteria bacterium]